MQKLSTLVTIITLTVSASVLAQNSGVSGNTPPGPAINLLVAGKDIAWPGGDVIRIAKRDGTSMEGIRIIKTLSDGQKITITAQTGTLAPGSAEDATDENAVRLNLYHLHVEKVTAGGKEVDDAEYQTFVLKK